MINYNNLQIIYDFLCLLAAHNIIVIDFVVFLLKMYN